MVNRLANPVIFHVQGGDNAGIQHQNVATNTAKDGAYENTITAAGATMQWYCHSPGPTVNNVRIATVAAP
jgi:uncharacterized protein involved in type VI secretion and phage assembly